jgi:hypothetical protein
MGPFEMVAIIVVVSVGGGVIMEYFKQKRRGAGSAEIDRLEKIIADTRAETARLQERVKVLERLVTDDDRRLASEIDRLRPGA